MSLLPTRPRILLAAAVLAAAVTAVGGGPARGSALSDPCPPARCADVVVPFAGHDHVPVNTVRVLVPPGYADHPSTCYPVLLLLHGAGDHFFTWTEDTDLAAFTAGLPASAPPPIIVMPDGGHDGDANGNLNPAGWYSDWVDGSRQFETFQLSTVLGWVRTHLRTRGDAHVAVAGLSMGGFGAMSYAARHPGMFVAAASFSGAVDMTYGAPASGEAFTVLHNQYGTPDQRVWGDQLSGAATWRAHNPTDLAARLAGTRLYLASGDGAPGGPAGDDPSNPGGYGLEQFIFQMNLSFVRALTLSGVPVQTNFYGGGYHGWPYWQMDLHWALPQLIRDLGASAPCRGARPPVAPAGQDGGRGPLVPSRPPG